MISPDSMPALAAGRWLRFRHSAPSAFFRQGCRDIRRYRLNLDTDPAAADGALSLSCAITFFTVGAGIEKAMPTTSPDGE